MNKLATLVVALSLVAEGTVQAQAVGQHHAPLGSGSGAGSDAVSPLGAYTTSVPLSFPQAESVPLSVDYVGGHYVGEAGVGWNMPMAYVRHTRSIIGSKPRANESITTTPYSPRGVDRVFLNLGGGQMLMNYVEREDAYYALVGDQFLRLKQIVAGRWLASDASGTIGLAPDHARPSEKTGWSGMAADLRVVDLLRASALCLTRLTQREPALSTKAKARLSEME